MPAVEETCIWSLDWEDALEKEMQATPVFLPGKSHGWRSLVGYSPWGRKESDTTEWLTLSFTLPRLFGFLLFQSQWWKILKVALILLAIIQKENKLQTYNTRLPEETHQPLRIFKMKWLITWKLYTQPSSSLCANAVGKQVYFLKKFLKYQFFFKENNSFNIKL